MPEKKKARKYRPRRERVTARKVTRHPEYQRVRLQAREAEKKLKEAKNEIRVLSAENKELTKAAKNTEKQIQDLKNVKISLEVEIKTLTRQLEKAKAANAS